MCSVFCPFHIGVRYRIWLLLILCFSAARLTAQPAAPVYVDTICIEGNRHTRSNIILRELPFKKGDSCQVSELNGWFEESKRALMNTMLFQEVVVTAARVFLPIQEGVPGVNPVDRIQVKVRVRERINIYPVFFVEPIDRNLNQWLFEQRASLDRVNFGAQLLLNNTTGRADRTIATLYQGYTEQLALSYELPYLGKQLKWGLRVGFSVGRNKEVNVATVNDKQVFLRDSDRFIRHFEQVFGELQYRPRINTRHSFGVQWMQDRVADTVRLRNPDYYPKGVSRLRYPRLQYTLNYQRVDYLPYPTKGPLAQLQVARSGIGSAISMWEVHAKAMMLWPIAPKWSWAWGVYAGWKSPSDQPFMNRRFLGYGTQFLSGYEYNVVDGLSGGLTRVMLTRQWVHHTIRIHYHRKKEPMRIPVRFMSRAFMQAGYVYDPEVPVGGKLANQWQYSGGLGLDLLLFYDVLFRLEYSVNRFGENGLFLHRKYPY